MRKFIAISLATVIVLCVCGNQRLLGKESKVTDGKNIFSPATIWWYKILPIRLTKHKLYQYFTEKATRRPRNML